ncbi:hypothetical protein K474DRAFT_915747 [Panus rudis PR-1116 ss-1]|nr:hypothetical protein K474DRAFT_915747 [Panus rudis PR-1116 ss-1]
MIYSHAVAWATLPHPNVLHIIGAYNVHLIDPPPRMEHLLVMPWLNNRNVSIYIRCIEEELHEQPPLSEWVRMNDLANHDAADLHIETSTG